MESFESYRPYLFSLAYQMMGSAQDAEDIVQETYLRYRATPPESIRSLKAYLTTISSRLCVDQLQLARRKREVYVGPWLPEPVTAAAVAIPGDPEQDVVRQESIGLAFLVLLEQLQPFERAVFLLREVFVYEFAEIATILGKSESACRRSFSRARAHLRAQRPRFPIISGQHRQILERYIEAVQTGEMAPLVGLLAEGATLWTDAGGNTKTAALRPIRGRDAVARMILGTKRFWPEQYSVEIGESNGQPALIMRSGGRAWSVVVIEADAQGIGTIWVLANPEKLTRV